jgi:hypothetical protein
MIKKGGNMPEAQKQKIRETMLKRWQNMDPEKLKVRKEKTKETWIKKQQAWYGAVED